MQDGIEITIESSITTGQPQKLYLSKHDVELIKGKKLDEVMGVTNKAVVEALDGLPVHKIHCSVLAEEAIKVALKDYYDKNGIDYDESQFPNCACCDHHCHDYEEEY